VLEYMSMNSVTLLLLVLIILIAIGIILMVIILQRLLNRPDTKADNFEHITLLQNQLQDLGRSLDERLSSSAHEMRHSLSTQLTSSQALIKEVTNRLLDVQKGLTESQESSKQVLTITQSLENLEKVLKNQKQRGSLGEAGLELILSNILPSASYELQYCFQDNQKCDAVIKAKEGLIPVDAKFSLDNYNRLIQEEDPIRREQIEKDFKADLKKRIDETAKYIRPQEGTLPFAIMYIPAEGIYYDLLINQVGTTKVNTRSLIEYAYRDRQVIIVSPTTFVAYLHTILQGFRAFQIEKSAVLIGERVEELKRHLKAFEDYHSKLGNALATTVNHYNASYKELGKIDKDVLRITGEKAGFDVVSLDKPQKDLE
jgi:DNA recombination protein RmuC